MGIPRNEGPEVDPTIVTHDAKDLYIKSLIDLKSSYVLLIDLAAANSCSSFL